MGKNKTTFEDSGFKIYGNFVLGNSTIEDSGDIIERIMKSLESLGLERDRLGLTNLEKTPVLVLNPRGVKDHSFYGPELHYSIKINGQGRLVNVRFFNFHKFTNVELITPSVRTYSGKSKNFTYENAEWFIKISKQFYNTLSPLYGSIGEEDWDYDPIEVLNHRKALPTDYAFYSRLIVECMGREKLESILKDSYHYEVMPDNGIFFQVTPWDVPPKDLKKLDKIKKKLHYVFKKSDFSSVLAIEEL